MCYSLQVPFARSSLNHDDVFILDTQNKIYQFNGANSNIQERAKALEVIQLLKEKYHDGTCDVAIVGKGACIYSIDDAVFPILLVIYEYWLSCLKGLFLLLHCTFWIFTYIWINVINLPDDGKLDTESDSGEFWVLFGGFAPIGKKVHCEDDLIPEAYPGKLYRYFMFLFASMHQMLFLCNTKCLSFHIFPFCI